MEEVAYDQAWVLLVQRIPSIRYALALGSTVAPWRQPFLHNQHPTPAAARRRPSVVGSRWNARPSTTKFVNNGLAGGQAVRQEK